MYIKKGLKRRIMPFNKIENETDLERLLQKLRRHQCIGWVFDRKAKTSHKLDFMCYGLHDLSENGPEGNSVPVVIQITRNQSPSQLRKKCRDFFLQVAKYKCDMRIVFISDKNFDPDEDCVTLLKGEFPDIPGIDTDHEHVFQVIAGDQLADTMNSTLLLSSPAYMVEEPIDLSEMEKLQKSVADFCAYKPNERWSQAPGGLCSTPKRKSKLGQDYVPQAHQQLEAAIPRNLRNSPVKPSASATYQPRKDDTRVWVYGLPAGTQPENLCAVFEKYGRVVSAYIRETMGIVTFATMTGKQEALANTTTFDSIVLRVE
ncbi:hypothetical protein Pelo_16231 [Pelomyxa schiedti]|nr:hypothetical protein Pelo_16231 [Pelomyxa schiedti]